MLVHETLMPGEETSHGRVVRVSVPTSLAALAVPVTPLTAFVLETRLGAAVAGSSGDAVAGGARVSQVWVPVGVHWCVGGDELSPLQ